MPIDFDKLTLMPISACLVVEETASLWQIHAMLPPDRDDRLYRFVIAPLADGTFLVARWIEVEEIVHRLTRYQDIRGWTLPELAATPLPPDYVEPDDYIADKLKDVPLATLIQRLTPVQGLDRQATTTHEARTVRDGHPGRRVVALDSGAIYGVIFEELLAAGDVAFDPFHYDMAQAMTEMTSDVSGYDMIRDAEPDPRRFPEPLPDIEELRGQPSADRGADVERAPVSALLNEVAATRDDRVFNLWIEQRLQQEAEIVGGGRTLTRIVPPGEALAIGGMYAVNVNVAPPLASARVRAGGVEQAEQMTAAAQIEVDVRLVADSAFFKVYGIPQQKIIFPRGGVSKNIASFRRRADQARDWRNHGDSLAQPEAISEDRRADSDRRGGAGGPASRTGARQRVDPRRRRCNDEQPARVSCRNRRQPDHRARNDRLYLHSRTGERVHCCASEPGGERDHRRHPSGARRVSWRKSSRNSIRRAMPMPTN